MTGGIGKVLLERMGWRAGTGLGKNREGIKVPLSVDIKTDRRGLCPCCVMILAFHVCNVIFKISHNFFQFSLI